VVLVMHYNIAESFSIHKIKNFTSILIETTFNDKNSTGKYVFISLHEKM